MTDAQKQKVTTLSVLLAFVVQLMGGVWFLSNMYALEKQLEARLGVVEVEQKKRTRNVYAIEQIYKQIEWIRDELIEIKKDIKTLNRRRTSGTH